MLFAYRATSDGLERCSAEAGFLSGRLAQLTDVTTGVMVALRVGAYLLSKWQKWL